MRNLLVDGLTLVLFFVATTGPGVLPSQSPGEPAVERPPVVWPFLDINGDFDCGHFMHAKPWAGIQRRQAIEIAWRDAQHERGSEVRPA